MFRLAATEMTLRYSANPLDQASETGGSGT